MRTLLFLALVLFAASPVASQDKKADGPIALKLIAKTDAYKFDAGGATPQAFKAKLDPDRWAPVYAFALGPRFAPRHLWAIAGAFGGGCPARLVARAVTSRRRRLSARRRL